jgi:hypothetical protein
MLFPLGRYVGPPLRGVVPDAWGTLSALLEGRGLDLISIFHEPPTTKVILGFSPLTGHNEPGAIGVVLECADDLMAAAVTPGGFDALTHVSYEPTQADVATVGWFGRPQSPSFTVADEDHDRALDADDFAAVVRRRIGRTAVLTRLRIAMDQEHQRLTATFIFRDASESMVALRVRPDGGSAWLDLRGVTLADLADEVFGNEPTA